MMLSTQHYSPTMKALIVGAHLSSHPSEIATYFRTLRKSPLQVGLPWISLGAIRFLGRALRPEMSVFEYGSGGSTLFFAQRCRSVVAIEDDPYWARIMGERVGAANLGNVIVELHPLESLATFGNSSYLRAIDCRSPDLVLIDGKDEDIGLFPQGGHDPRRRTQCFRYVEQRIKPGGMIVVDDSSFYADLRSTSKAKQVLSFTGIGPCRPGITSTDVFLY
jgi:predicted O-methyltransferase YrrM